VPIRTCLGCRRKSEGAALWRFALDAHGVLRKDFRNRHGGRHVYCCKDAECLRKFLKNNKELTRAFRQQVLGFDEELNDLFGSVE